MILALIFSSQNYFRLNYLDVFSFAVSISIYIWYKLKKIFCSTKSCQQISCDSNRLHKGCEWNWGDQLNIALKIRIQIILMIEVVKIIEKYLYISNVKFTMKGCQEDIVVFWLFFRTGCKVSTWQVSSSSDQPFNFFAQK